MFPPAAILSLRVSDDETTREQEMIAVVRQHTTEAFSTAPITSFAVSILSGGITNQLYRVTAEVSPSNQCSVVVRVFGKETERIISRDSELFYQAVFLRTYCQGANFLVYEFLEGFRDLPFSDLGRLRRPIAVSLADFHFRATMHSKTTSRYDGERVMATTCLTEWWSQALGAAAQDKLSDQQRSILLDGGVTRGAVDIVVDRLKKRLAELEGSLVLGVCHNDLLCANVMRSVAHATTEPHVAAAVGEESLALIDFEYASKNFVLYDFANHFNEYCGLLCDYDTYFPSDDIMLDAILVYRQAMRERICSVPESECPFGNEDKVAFGTQWITEAKDSEELAAACVWVQHVKLLTLVSHAIWTAWSILQAAHSVIDFDFASYAVQRWSQLCKTLEQFDGR